MFPNNDACDRLGKRLIFLLAVREKDDIKLAPDFVFVQRPIRGVNGVCVVRKEQQFLSVFRKEQWEVFIGIKRCDYRLKPTRCPLCFGLSFSS